HAVLYVQKYVPNLGHDLRVFVIGARVVAAMRRHAKPNDWRSNLALGGRAEGIELDNETERLAVAAAHAVGSRWAGVDLLPSFHGEPLVLEVNAVPGWKGLSATTTIDVAAEILRDLKQLIRAGQTS